MPRLRSIRWTATIRACGGQPDASSELSTLRHMEANRRLITVTELDSMTPNERAATVAAHVVTDLAALPVSFRDRVVATGHRLTAERNPAEAG